MQWSELVGLRHPGEIRLATTAMRQRWLLNTYPPDIQSQTRVGIEIECENVRNRGDIPQGNQLHVYENSWIQKEDGSLRNHGAEFVTRVGMTAEQAGPALRVLDDVFGSMYPEITANNRTGVHVHLNCLNKTIPQIVAVCMAYCLVEKSLFLFSGGRTENIFCVPVRSSDNVVPEVIRSYKATSMDDYRRLSRAIRRSPKYLAFNLGALTNFGTIEFRHAQGTAKPSTIIPWLKTLVHLFDYASTQDVEAFLERIRVLNTTSQYESLIREMLPEFFIQTVGLGMLISDMTQGSTFVKMALIPPEEGEVVIAVEDGPDVLELAPPNVGVRRVPEEIIDDRGGLVQVPPNLTPFDPTRYILHFDPDRVVWYLYDRSRRRAQHLTYELGNGTFPQWEAYIPEIHRVDLIRHREQRILEIRQQQRVEAIVPRPVPRPLRRRLGP